VLGIAAIPFLCFGLLAAGIFGKVVILAFIGRACTPTLAKDPVAHTVVGVLVGGAIVLFLYTIPVVGFIVYKLLGILGLGVVVYTLLLTFRAGRQARPAGGPSGSGSGGVPGPGSAPSTGATSSAGGGPGAGPGVSPGAGLGVHGVAGPSGNDSMWA